MEENVKALFKKIYNVESNNNEQLESFMEYLRDRLTYTEKRYLLEKYNIDLLEDEDYEVRIKKAMVHPVITKELLRDNKNVLSIYDNIKSLDTISITSLQKDFSMSFPVAKKAVEDLLEFGYIEPVNNRIYKVKKVFIGVYNYDTTRKR